MSYLRSAARDAFEQRINKLRSAAKVAGTKSQGVPSQVREIAFHAAILETSAALEEYIKSLLEDYEFKALQFNLPLARLPDSIRTHLFIQRTRPHFENLSFLNDEKRALKKLDIKSDFFQVLDSNATVGTDIKIISVIEGKKYPSIQNWEILFLRLGITNIFAQVNIRLRRDSKFLLESFNDVRTALAHGEPPNLTYQDIQRHLDNMKSFIKGVDRVLCSHLCYCSGKEIWPTSRD